MLDASSSVSTETSVIHFQFLKLVEILKCTFVYVLYLNPHLGVLNNDCNLGTPSKNVCVTYNGGDMNTTYVVQVAHPKNGDWEKSFSAAFKAADDNHIKSLAIPFISRGWSSNTKLSNKLNSKENYLDQVRTN